MDATTANLLPRTSVRTKGFGLIELMIAVAIVAILAAIAYPSYTEYVSRGRRADGKAALLRIQQAQERWRSSNTVYATKDQLSAAPYSVPMVSENGYYELEVSVDQNPIIAAQGYSATAKPKGTQTKDTKCANLTVTLAAGVLTYGASGSASSDAKSYCWGK